ncbi:MAG: DMT family transporter [Crocinitomicaceae bacterium]
MINLLLGILFFNVILIIFKLFEKYGVDNLQAIIVNYVVASTLGILTCGIPSPILHIADSSWIWIALTIGFFFVVVFNLLAKGAQKVGMAVSTVANKMSVIIPVIFAFAFLGNHVTLLKIVGITLALIGVYFTTTNGSKLNFDKKYLPLILIIFFGQGIADCLFNYAQHHYVESEESKIFISTMFAGACITGLVLLIPQLIQKKSTLKFKNVLWGIGLGIPNFLTVYYFFQALESGIMESSQVYPILNMGVIVLSALSGYLLFKERLSKINWLGIFISLLAIAAITFG